MKIHLITYVKHFAILNVFFTFIILYLLLYSSVSAQSSPKENASKYGIAFPISELGNCGNVAACKAYCDLSENKPACTNFAKSKGFLKGKAKVKEKQVAALASAKSELSCTTIEKCKTFCDDPANQEACISFAKRHELVTSAVVRSEDNKELIKAAEKELGCNSQESCFALCEQKGNYERCAALAQSELTSEDRAFFEEHRSDFQSILGCNSIQSCMAFCMNPLNMPKCMEFAKQMGFDTSTQGSPPEPPEIWCPKISSECLWNGTDCVCNGPESCQKNPECSWDGKSCNCSGDSTFMEEPGETWCPKAGPYCFWDGTSCTCWNPQECKNSGCSWTGTQCDCGNVGPEVWCPRSGEGCSWDGKQCNCPGVSMGGSTAEPGDVWCPKLGPYCVWDGSSCACWDDCIKAGGTWTGSRCDFPAPTPEPPEIWCPRNPDCTWTGETCQCTPVEIGEQTPATEVKGEATTNILREILHFLLRLE